MLKLADLVPLNFAEEREKFFAKNFSYNPQFIYPKEISPKELLVYGKAKLRYKILAQYILEKNKNYFKLEKNKKILEKKELEAIIKEYLHEYGLENEYQIVFSEKYISRFSVQQKRREIRVRLPILISEKEAQSSMDHEIGTHVLRQLNYQKQIWYKKRRKFAIKHNYLKTEEGLSSVHSLLNAENKGAQKNAINYLAVDLAQKKDFISTFQFLSRYIDDPQRAFLITFKKKRGLRDTSQAGGFTKDLLYFEGFVEVLRYLKRNNFDPTFLYYGKFSLQDKEKIKELSPNFQPVLPKFYLENPALYRQKIQSIIEQNFPPLLAHFF